MNELELKTKPNQYRETNNFSPSGYSKEDARSIPLISVINQLGLKVNPSGYIKSIYKEDKTPSTKIYEFRFQDYSTNKGGDQIDFVQDYLHLDFKDALRWIGETFNLKRDFKPMKKETIQTVSISTEKNKIELLQYEKDFFEERASIYEYEAALSRGDAETQAEIDIMQRRKEIQIEVYSFLYRESLLTDSAIEYLTSEKRKLTRETINKFCLFSIEDETETFLRDEFTEYELNISGLFKNGRFLFHDHTLIIPYFENGKIVSLKGRYFKNGEYNPPEGKGKYKELNNLAGNLHAKRFFNVDTVKEHRSKEVIICEGEFDCMAAEQIGDPAIGIPGVGNFPYDFVNRLNGYDVYLCFDKDKAGELAAKETKEKLKGKVKSVTIVIPKGKDLTEAIC